MRLASPLKSRLCLLLGGAAAVAGFLAYGRTVSVPPSNDRVVWVYFASLCAAPGDASDCTEIKQPIRRAFASQEACSAYRDVDLNHLANPRLLGSCLRQHEA
jgi:predicted ATPase